MISFHYVERGLPSLLPRSGCSSDAMEILGQLRRHIIIDDRLDAFDIQTSGSQVGSHQIVHRAISELLQGSQTLDGGVSIVSIAYAA